MPPLLQAGGWQEQLRTGYGFLVESAPRILFRVLVALFLYSVARWTAGKVIDTVLASLLARSGSGSPGQAARLRTLQGLLRSGVNYLLAFVALAMILDAFGLNIAALLAGAGLAGMAVGFGAQRLVRDVITGFFLIMEDQYAVGDRVTIGAFTGEVVEIGMRITRLREDSGRLVILANGDVSTVVNHSRGPLLAAVEVSLPRSTDLDALQAQLAALPLDLSEGPLLEPPTLRGVTALDASNLSVRLAAPARPGKQQEAEMLLRQRLNQALGAAPLSSPSPAAPSPAAAGT